MNNPNYGFSSPSSFTPPYSSTPPAALRPSRPRFAYSGPSMYPRPRSSASKPNPNSSFPGNRANNFDGNVNVDGENKLNQASFRSDNSNTSLYYSCNESFYESPNKFSGGISNNLEYQHCEPTNDNNFDPYVQNSGNTEQHGNATSQNMYGRNMKKNSQCNPPFSYDNDLCKSSENFPQFHNNVSNQNEFREGSNFGMQQNSHLPYDKKNIQVNKPFPLGVFQKFQNSNQKFGAIRKKIKGKKSMANKDQMRCELCNLDFTSSIPLEMHLRGAKHTKKLKAQNALETIQLQGNKEIDAIGKAFRCEACNITLNSSLQLQMHLEGNKHKNKVVKLELAKEVLKEQALEKAGKEVSEKPCKEDPEKICKNDSEVTFVVKGTEQNGKGNGSLIRPLPEDFDNPRPAKFAKYSCDICNIIVNSESQLQQHLRSKKHEAKVSGKPLVKARRFRKVKVENQVNTDDNQANNQGDIKTEDGKVEEVSEPKQSQLLGVKSLEDSFVPGELLE